jgi:hypothetical protein
MNEFSLDTICDDDTCMALLEFLYTGSDTVITPDLVVSLMSVSDRLLLEDLKQLCERTLEQSLDEESSCWMLEAADRFNAPRLKRAAKELITNSKETLLRIHASEAFAEMRLSAPHLVRDLDYIGSKNNFTTAGFLLRAR